MNLMLENARQYNPPDSKLYKDSIRLQKVLQKKMAEMSADFDEVCAQTYLYSPR